MPPTHCQAGSQAYLIGSSNEPEDVHRGVRLHVVAEQGVEVGDGRQRAVFVGHTVQVPEGGSARQLLETNQEFSRDKSATRFLKTAF